MAIVLREVTVALLASVVLVARDTIDRNLSECVAVRVVFEGMVTKDRLATNTCLCLFHRVRLQKYFDSKQPILLIEG